MAYKSTTTTKVSTLTFVSLCLSLFSAQVWDQVWKYVSKKTTIVFETKIHEELFLPAMAICAEPQLNEKVGHIRVVPNLPNL